MQKLSESLAQQRTTPRALQPSVAVSVAGDRVVGAKI